MAAPEAEGRPWLGVVVQAGGRGERLWPLTAGAPKALAPFAGGSLLGWQLQRAAALRPGGLVVIGGYRGPELRPTCDLHGAELVLEERPLGTAGGLHLLPAGPERWLCVNVDHASDVDLADFVDGPPGHRALLWELELAVDEGVVELEQGLLRAWRERPRLRLPVTTGLYRLEAGPLRRQLGGGPLDMPALIGALMPEGVQGRLHGGWWLDVGTPARLAEAEARLTGGPASRPDMDQRSHRPRSLSGPQGPDIGPARTAALDPDDRSPRPPSGPSGQAPGQRREEERVDLPSPPLAGEGGRRP